MTFRFAVSNGELATRSPETVTNSDIRSQRRYITVRELAVRLVTGRRFVTVAHGCQPANPGTAARQTVTADPSSGPDGAAGLIGTDGGCSCVSACRLSPTAIAAVVAYLRPPRSRYAVVVTAAFVGAGVVALGAGSDLPDAKAVNPTVAAEPRDRPGTADDLADRDRRRRARLPWRRPRRRTARAQRRGGRGRRLAAAAGASTRSRRRTASAVGQAARRHRPGRRRGHPVQGDPRRQGDRGRLQRRLRLRDHHRPRRRHRDPSTAHSRRLLVKVGDMVRPGQVIGEVGNTGYSYGTHLHIEIHVNGEPTDPIPLPRRATALDVRRQDRRPDPVPAAAAARHADVSARRCSADRQGGRSTGLPPATALQVRAPAGTRSAGRRGAFRRSDAVRRQAVTIGSGLRRRRDASRSHRSPDG